MAFVRDLHFNLLKSRRLHFIRQFMDDGEAAGASYFHLVDIPAGLTAFRTGFCSGNLHFLFVLPAVNSGSSEIPFFWTGARCLATSLLDFFCRSETAAEEETVKAMPTYRSKSTVLLRLDPIKRRNFDGRCFDFDFFSLLFSHLFSVCLSLSLSLSAVLQANACRCCKLRPSDSRSCTIGVWRRNAAFCADIALKYARLDSLFLSLPLSSSLPLFVSINKAATAADTAAARGPLGRERKSSSTVAFQRNYDVDSGPGR